MAKKKRKSPTMNAIDKYLMQKKYSRASLEKFKSPSLSPKVVQFKNSSLNQKVKQTKTQSLNGNVILPSVKTLRSFKVSVNAKVDDKTESKKSSNGRKCSGIDFLKLKLYTEQKFLQNITEAIQPINNGVFQIPEKIEPKIQKNGMTKKSKSMRPAKMATTQKRKSEEQSFTDFKKRQRVEFKIVKKLSKAVKNAQSSEPSRKAVKNTRKRKGEAILSTNHKSKIGVTTKQSEVTENIEVEQKMIEKVPKNVRRKHIKDIALSNKKPAQSDFKTCNQSTSLMRHRYRDNSSSDESSNEYQDTSEINPIMKKYQPYMKRIKSLNSEEIAKFIKDNQQYYIDFKNGIELKDKRRPKKPKEEMKSLFKCNPFNSEQQIAMYITLREVFNIPQTHFKECRNFFISLLPEISCQLFADVFRIKTTFAPRLIKRLYPKPVCPV